MVTGTSPLRGPLRKRNSHLWERDERDWYVEPEWCSERLFEMEKFEGSVCDPAAGCGRIVRSAIKAGVPGYGSDIEPRSEDVAGPFDFLSYQVEAMAAPNIVSNPPFRRAEQFAKLALQVASCKVALLLTANWVQGDKRSRWLETTPLRRVLYITPRPSMPPGAVLAAGGKPGNGTTDYAWYVWEHSYTGKPEIGWCRR